MGDTYSEVITAMNEKLLKAKNYKNMRNESTILLLNPSEEKNCLVWMEYYNAVKSTWKSQTDEITKNLKKSFKDVLNKF